MFKILALKLLSHGDSWAILRAAVQKHAETNGYSVVRDFGGHGIGLEFHEDPFVAHVGEKAGKKCF